MLFDEDGNVLIGTSLLDEKRADGSLVSEHLDGSTIEGSLGYHLDGRVVYDYTVSARYGLNTETANKNYTFKIDKNTGVINFSSDMADEEIILEYVSDGMENGTDSD